MTMPKEIYAEPYPKLGTGELDYTFGNWDFEFKKTPYADYTELYLKKSHVQEVLAKAVKNAWTDEMQEFINEVYDNIFSE